MARADVPRYFRVSVRFWTDEKARDWPDNVRLLALYLLTCSHRTLEGIFVLPLQYVVADCPWSLKWVKKSMAVLTKDGFLRYDPVTKVMLIRNALKYQCPENENVIKGAIRRILDLPQSPLLIEFLGLAKLHCNREGASELAKDFYLRLERALERASEPPLELLNLNLPSLSKSESSSEPPLVAEEESSDLLLEVKSLEERTDKKSCGWHTNGTQCLHPASERHGQAVCQWHYYVDMQHGKVQHTFQGYCSYLKGIKAYESDNSAGELWQQANSKPG